MKILLVYIIYFSELILVAFYSLKGRVEIGLLFLIPIFPLRNIIEQIQQLPFGKDFTDILLILLIIGWFIKSKKENRRLFIRSPFNLLLFFIIIYTYISLWIGSFNYNLPYPIHSSDIRLQFWKNYITFPLIFFLVFNNIKEVKHMKLLVIAKTLAMFLMFYYTIHQIQWLSGPALKRKLHGTFATLGPNELSGFYAAYLFVLAGIMSFSRSKIFKLFLLIAVILGSYCILFLYSRGAYLATIVSLVIFLLIKSKKLLIPLIIIALFWQAFLPANVINRIAETKNEYGELDRSSELRIIVWEKSIEMFKNNPVFGVGFNTSTHFGFELGDTHNIYLKILVEQGIIGFLLFLILLFLSSRYSWRLYKKGKDPFLKGIGLGLFICIISLSISNLFGDRWTHLEVGAYFWSFLGLVAKGNTLINQEKKC